MEHHLHPKKISQSRKLFAHNQALAGSLEMTGSYWGVV